MANTLTVLVLMVFVSRISCTTSPRDSAANNMNIEHNTNNNLVYKVAGMGSILVAGGVGVSMPLLLRNVKAFQPETPIHFVIKAFAAGVILATGFIHILPDAFQSLTSPCLSKNPWTTFPFAGFIAMVAAILTLTMEAFATGYHTRSELQKPQPLDDTENNNSAIVTMLQRSNSSTLLRTRIVSQVPLLSFLVLVILQKQCQQVLGWLMHYRH